MVVVVAVVVVLVVLTMLQLRCVYPHRSRLAPNSPESCLSGGTPTKPSQQEGWTERTFTWKVSEFQLQTDASTDDMFLYASGNPDTEP